MSDERPGPRLRAVFFGYGRQSNEMRAKRWAVRGTAQRCGGPQWGMDNAAADAALARGLSSHRAGDLATAKILYGEVLAGGFHAADAWHLRGLVDHQEGEHRLAIERIGRAIELSPKTALYRSNQALALMADGQVDQAVATAMDALDLDSNQASRSAFVQTVRDVQFNQGDPRAAKYVRQALESPWLRPAQLRTPALSLLRSAPAVAAALGEGGVDFSWEGELCGALADEPLLLAAFEAFALPDRQFEDLVRRMRRAWTLALPEAAGSGLPLPGKILRLAMALAIQCDLTEGACAADAPELSRVDRLRSCLESALAARAPLSPWQWGALCCYMPLADLPGSSAIRSRKWPPAAKQGLARLLDLPLLAREKSAAIERATATPTEVSQAVRAQYELNPYPRWSSTCAPASGLGVAAQALFDLGLPAKPAESLGREQALVAGCGTGLQSCELAMRHPGTDIFAIDLSLASLGYAEAKARMLGLPNLRHAQADILEVASLGRRFQAIECVGVLHHMADPMAGWRALLAILDPGGVMKVGLYSRAARSSINAARKLAAGREAGPGPEALRRWRAELAASKDPELAPLARMPDFYSLSEFRDLALHVQEASYDIPWLRSAMEALGLEFLGFSTGAQAKALWRSVHGTAPVPRDLAGWELVERLHPHVFLGMYQFHVRKATK